MSVKPIDVAGFLLSNFCWWMNNNKKKKSAYLGSPWHRQEIEKKRAITSADCPGLLTTSKTPLQLLHFLILLADNHWLRPLQKAGILQL